MKPIAYDIDTKRRNTANLPKPGGFAIMYKCPYCGQKFSPFISEKELNYCYNCGGSIFWGGCIAYLNSKQSNSYLAIGKEHGLDIQEKLRVGLLELVNKENERTEVKDMVYIMEED